MCTNYKLTNVHALVETLPVKRRLALQTLGGSRLQGYKIILIIIRFYYLFLYTFKTPKSTTAVLVKLSIVSSMLIIATPTLPPGLLATLSAFLDLGELKRKHY